MQKKEKIPHIRDNNHADQIAYLMASSLKYGAEKVTMADVDMNRSVEVSFWKTTYGIIKVKGRIAKAVMSYRWTEVTV
jgi:hypothetical protein